MYTMYCLDGNAGSSLNQRCEKDPKHLPLGIAIDRLTKVFHYMA